MFLPSIQDYYNSEYGFLTNQDRLAKCTEWARAVGAYYYSDIESASYFTSSYWSRSPTFDVEDGDFADIIMYRFGERLHSFVKTPDGVRPAIKII